ncbi:hypothetical protein CEXT_443781 [Caerostris extrusa]|uniref:Uncharacterized protein n=1 Tax=Caerostris extrusa TaxID=172846 RepID=A0AAV4XXW3_CAEEX|nr:hypothetical protein CEXT_443781 [Caerostris extrusa]
MLRLKSRGAPYYKRIRVNLLRASTLGAGAGSLFCSSHRARWLLRVKWWLWWKEGIRHTKSSIFICPTLLAHDSATTNGTSTMAHVNVLAHAMRWGLYKSGSWRLKSRHFPYYHVSLVSLV